MYERIVWMNEWINVWTYACVDICKVYSALFALALSSSLSSYAHALSLESAAALSQNSVHCHMYAYTLLERERETWNVLYQTDHPHSSDYSLQCWMQRMRVPTLIASHFIQLQQVNCNGPSIIMLRRITPVTWT